jgi:hypothetical protein
MIIDGGTSPEYFGYHLVVYPVRGNEVLEE